MKKRILFSLIAGIAVGAISDATAQAEYSGTLGYSTITLGPGYNFVGVNFKNTSENETFDIQTLFDTSKLHGSTSQLGSDQLFLWDASNQEYVELWLYDSGSSNPDYDQKWIDVGTGDVAAKQVGLGDGFWYIRHTNAPEEIVEMTVTGAVEESTSVSHSIAPPPEGQNHSYNLFASAYPVDKPVNEMVWSGFSGGTSQLEADQLFLWDATHQEYAKLWLYDSGGTNPDYAGKWIDVETGDVAGSDRIIAAGATAWVLKKTEDDIDEAKPF